MVYSIQEVWDDIMLQLKPENGSILINISDPNQFIFNVSILSDIDVTETSNLTVPFMPDYENYTITLNIKCIQTWSYCNINIYNGAIFIYLEQTNENSNKLLITAESLVFFHKSCTYFDCTNIYKYIS